ncbi:hypothetical protein [Methylocystis parvus]|uniref:DUF2267 domain-containing protein n=1 Tax=Methylocystis parvus TaxID=134 RepID=A0A6B8MCP0_9HYPH|nr:hypothetical protein [Methylocystis parvus]QGM99083.1 hypothetical protein F7D14_17385 [Methylocystis parvus]WBK00549.1 hypothetical protein MMG94_02155 [Methylocystis parvus OBBP]
MEELSRRVVEATSLEPSIAKAAIGHVLRFLRDEVPDGHVGEFIDKMPGARQAVAAAQASSDGGVTQAIEGMTSFMGHGRADLNILVGKLANLGLTQAQSERLIEETLLRAESLIGAEGVARIKSLLPALAQRSGVTATNTEKPDEMRPGL